MNRGFFIVTLIFIAACHEGSCQVGDTLITSRQFMGIRLGETSFKEAGAILNPYAYKTPKLHFKSIRWRDGGCMTLFTHRYVVKIKRSKLEVTLYGYSNVGRIRISAQGKTRLSYHGLLLGRSRIKEMAFTGTGWEPGADIDGNAFMMNQFNGITVYVAGDSLDIQKHSWSKQRIKKITLTNAGK